MDRKPDSQGFNASAEGGFTESGSWQIAPRLWYSDDLSTGKRAAVSGEAREQLLGRILEQALRGKTLGADRIHVLRDDGERVIVVGPEKEPSEDPNT